MCSDSPLSPQEEPTGKSVAIGAAADEYRPEQSDASKNNDREDFKAMRSEARKDKNNEVAAFLARYLWIMLFLTIAGHLTSTIYFSSHLLSSDKSVELEKVQGAVAMVNDTSKTLYSFLGTLVTAVTAYYFKTLLDESNNNDSKNP